jgi:hypothetical protein
MEANSTAHKSLFLTQQGSYRIIVNTPSDYTILSAAITEDSFVKWQKGQFNVSWDGNCYGCNTYGLSGNCKSYYAGFTEGQVSMNQSIIFWNSDSYSKQVNLVVFIEGYGIDQTGLSNANLLLTAGGIGLGLIAVFLVLKNRGNIKVTRKKALTLLLSLLMFAGGLFLADAFSGQVEAQNVIDHGVVAVPANDYFSLGYVISQSGDYLAQFNVDRGTIQAFHSGDGSVFSHWGNGTDFDIRDESYPSFNGSSGLTGNGVIGDESAFPYTTYYVLSNVDDYSKNVTYEISYRFTYNNYVAMMSGIALAIFGGLAFILTLLKGKLKDFNKALDNQE